MITWLKEFNRDLQISSDTFVVLPCNFTDIIPPALFTSPLLFDNSAGKVGPQTGWLCPDDDCTPCLLARRRSGTVVSGQLVCRQNPEEIRNDADV